jgi:ABC-type polysaccharide/polyol phosphate export permease
MNPVAAPVEAFRWCLLGGGSFDPRLVGTSLLITGILVFTGLVAFQKASRSAVDVV